MTAPWLPSILLAGVVPGGLLLHVEDARAAPDVYPMCRQERRVDGCQEAARSPCQGRGEAPRPDVGADSRPEIAQVVLALEKTLGCDGKRDEESVRLAQSLADHHPRAGPKDQTTIVRVLGRALVDPRKKPRGKEPLRDELPRRAVEALGGMGELGGRELERALAGRALRANPDLEENALAAYGRTRAKRAFEMLVERVSERSLPSLRGSARGLVHFHDADGAARKRAFEALFRALIALADEARSSGNTQAWMAKDLFEGARADGYSALEALAGAREVDIDSWQRWWNKNKHRSWEQESR